MQKTTSHKAALLVSLHITDIFQLLIRLWLDAKFNKIKFSSWILLLAGLEVSIGATGYCAGTFGIRVSGTHCNKFLCKSGKKTHTYWSMPYLYKLGLLLMSLAQGRTDGGQGNTIPRALNHWGAPKSPNNVARTFFNTAHLLRKGLKFEHGGVKLVSCPGCHLASVRPGFGVCPMSTEDQPWIRAYYKPTFESWPPLTYCSF